MRLKIVKLQLANFKGVKELTVNFGDHTTEIKGRNGSGKTTIFDAFTWLLFGKNSEDKKQFSIKTVDVNGEPIHHLTHEVSGVFEIDGTTVELTRQYREKWQKKRGQAEEEMTSHEEVRLYNGVPCSVAEWKEKVSAMVQEETFKSVTDVFYFVSQKPEVQRELLFQMAGGVKDEDVAKGNADFEALLKEITGKSYEEFRRELLAKMRMVKDEVAQLPSRIAEAEQLKPANEDWDSLKAGRQALVEALERIEEDINSESKRIETYNRAVAEAVNQVMTERNKLTAIKGKIKTKALCNLNESVLETQRQLGRKEQLKQEYKLLLGQFSALGETKKELVARRNEMLDEYKRLKAMQPDANSYSCPTCGAIYPEDKQAEIIAQFNVDKASKIQANIDAGKAIAKKIAKIEAQRSELDEKLTEFEEQIHAINVQGSTAVIDITNEQLEELCLTDGTYLEQMDKVKEAGDALDKAEKNVPTEVTAELKEQRESYKRDIVKVDTILANEAVIERHNKRIAELEAQLKAGNAELAQLERKEYLLKEFLKARTESIEGRINSMFKIVKWKLYSRQLNGGEVACCEATINGVPYADANNASKINAGIDICNTIRSWRDIAVPLFIDNAESIINTIETDAQVVKLIVADCDLSISTK